MTTGVAADEPAEDPRGAAILFVVVYIDPETS
jgi:hypothetical protein